MSFVIAAPERAAAASFSKITSETAEPRDPGARYETRSFTRIDYADRRNWTAAQERWPAAATGS